MKIKNNYVLAKTLILKLSKQLSNLENLKSDKLTRSDRKNLARLKEMKTMLNNWR